MTVQHQTDTAQYVTIIAEDLAGITREFQAQGLSEANYAIVHQVGSHRFMKVAGDRAETLFEGQRMIAATYARRSD